MTMNSSGPISLAGTTAGQSIEIENGGNGTTQISLNCTAVRTLAGVPSGTIIMPTNFYGKSNQYTYTVSSNQTNFCMRAGAISAGWNGSSKLVVNINSGVIISSNSTGANAMTIQGSFPGGVTVTNNGTIAGMGGGGARGGSCYPTNGSSGSGGGGRKNRDHIHQQVLLKDILRATVARLAHILEKQRNSHGIGADRFQLHIYAAGSACCVGCNHQQSDYHAPFAKPIPQTIIICRTSIHMLFSPRYPFFFYSAAGL